VKAEDIPWGKAAMVEIPEESWSDDWLMGIRSKTWLGEICSCHRGGVCVQPRRESQGEGMQPPCISFDPDKVKITVLDGKLSDH